MSEQQQIPTSDELSTPAIDALVAARPRASSHIETGRYGDIIAGWKAQTRPLRARMASEVAATRLPLAGGAELRDLVRSEYSVVLDETPGTAVGGIILHRRVQNTNSGNTGNFTPGNIRAGHRFRKVADPLASPPVQEANYTTTTTTVVDSNDSVVVTPIGGGQYVHNQYVTVRVIADRPGPHANAPRFSDILNATFATSDTLFDSTFEVFFGVMAGGFLEIGDPAIRALAQANYLGQFGPTTGALIAGTLGSLGAEHLAVVEDTTNAITLLYAADGTWAMSTEFLAALAQKLKDDVTGRAGFGCRFAMRSIVNKHITIKATALLTDPKYASDTTSITQALQKRLRSYFDDRPDFYTWDLDMIGATIVGADARILSCPSVVVQDYLGAPIAQPAAKINPASDPILHYFLGDNAVQMTYTTPS